MKGLCFFWGEKHGTSRSPPRAGSPRVRNAIRGISQGTTRIQVPKARKIKIPILTDKNFDFSGAQDGT